MKIKSKDFRVREGDEVDLRKWPTRVDPVYQSKENYKKLLREHVVQLSSPATLTPRAVGGDGHVHVLAGEGAGEGSANLTGSYNHRSQYSSDPC